MILPAARTLALHSNIVNGNTSVIGARLAAAKAAEKRRTPKPSGRAVANGSERKFPDGETLVVLQIQRKNEIRRGQRAAAFDQSRNL